MRRLTIALLGAALILGGSGAAQAGLITVDPDSFALGTFLTNAFPGVTLRSIGLGFDGDSDPGIYGIDPTAHLEPYTASTGRLVFGTNDRTFPHLFSGVGGAVLRIDFAAGVDWVSLDGISNDAADIARLQAFTAGGVLLDTYTTASMGTNVFEAMIVSSPAFDIAYVIASGVSGNSVGFDSLQYNEIPEPASLVLVGTGLGLLAARRRKQRN